MNPLMKVMGKNNPINKMIEFMNGGGNPMQFAQQLLSINPQLQQIMNQMQSECGNRSPKDYAIEMCKKQGGDPEQLMALARKMGVS